MLSVFHPLHRNVLKEIPSCPETMKYSKWRIYRHRSVPFSPDDREGSGGIRGKRELAKYLKWSRVEALLSPSFIERQSKVSGYSNAASHFGNCHYRVDALHRSVSDLSPGWRVWKPRSIVSKRFSMFLNRWQDATSRLARQFLAGCQVSSKE